MALFLESEIQKNRNIALHLEHAQERNKKRGAHCENVMKKSLLAFDTAGDVMEKDRGMI